MADVTFKKSLILIVLIFAFLFQSFAQKKAKRKEFTKEFPVFITELNDFMTASDNSDLKITVKLFSKHVETFTLEEQASIMDISNDMLNKRMRPNPHFSAFLSSLILVNNHTQGERMLPEWLSVVEQTLDNTTPKKLMLFYAFTNNLIKENTLKDVLEI